jgi:LPXTG-site transpeptidase (sortase) family protein
MAGNGQTFKEKISKFAKIFILVFLIVFAVANKEELKEIFDYKEIFSELFYSKEKESSPGKVGDLREKEYPFSEKSNILEIPKLEVEVPIIFQDSSEISVLEERLNEGAVFYPGSALPGQPGNTVIFGHSAPFGWPKANYNWIFSDINNLEKGDEIFVFFDNKKHSYKVTKKDILEKGEEVPLESLRENTNSLVLVSCWPPGKDYKRIAVWAE